jgi:polysaccharide pyruvyl transferase WcaK-like protein
MDVLLLGYYGRGNFGDDVLLKVTHALVKRAWPRCALFARCSGDAPGYVPRLLGDPSLTVLPYAAGRRFDVIVHGGGGTFFDFAVGSGLDAVVNLLVRSGGGALYARAEGWARALLGRPRDTARVRIGWGIGVGTFTRSSRALRHKVQPLLDFDGLMVRDEESLRNLKALGLSVSAERGSDVAFLHELWSARRPRRAPSPGGRRRLGIVLRDWGGGGRNPAHARAVVETAHALACRYDITFLLLDAADRETAALVREWPVVAWDPHAASLEEFATAVASVDLLLTSRAHGAICGAALGVPSALIDIEPKLRAVHDMLPRSTRIVSASPAADELLRTLDELSGLDPSVLASEVASNRALAAASVARLVALAKGVVDA